MVSLHLTPQSNLSLPITFTQLLQDETVVKIDCNDGHALALTASGVVYTWGSSRHGALSNGDV